MRPYRSRLLGLVGLLLVLLRAAQVPAQDLTTGLIHYWKLDDTTGAALDAAGSGTLTWNGTQSWLTAASCHLQGCAGLNGSSWLRGALQGIGNDATASVAFWVWYSSPPDAWVVTFGVQGGTALVQIGSDGNHHVYMNLLQSNGGFATVVSPGSMTANTWNCVGVVLNGAAPSVKLYLGGTLNLTDTTWDGTTWAGIGNVTTLGAGPDDAYPFTGRIDEVRLWNGVKTDADMSAYCAFTGATIGRTRQPMGRWIE